MDKTKPVWPRNGFESHIAYISNFIHLNINRGSPESCKQYHDRWMERYRTKIKNWTDLDICIWTLRCRQSLKLCFTATFFALSAAEIEKLKIRPAEHYMAYYGMLHAMWAVLYLHPEQTTENITQITHSKLARIYQAEFVEGRNRIIVEDARKLAEDLRYVREYYSYKMPLNPPFERNPELTRYSVRLGGFIKQSIQLANLHSHMIRKASERLHKSGTDVSIANTEAFRKAFFAINGQEHQSRSLLLMDDADQVALSEFLARGCDLLPLSLGYEHMSDNYMTWGTDRPASAILGRVNSLVWHALY